MSHTPVATAPSFFDPALQTLVRLLAQAASASSGPWRSRPDAALDGPGLVDALAALTEPTKPDLLHGVLLVSAGTDRPATLYLSANAWRAALAAWPASGGAHALLDALAAMAPAIRAGAPVVGIALTFTEAVSRELDALPLPHTVLLSDAPPRITDTAGLLAAAVGSRGAGALVDLAPYTEQNRYAALAVAVDRGAGSPGDAGSLLIAHSLLAQILALRPGSADRAQAVELPDGNGAFSGVLRLDSNALQGLSPGQWVQSLVDQGVLQGSQVLHTTLASAPTSLQAFNDALRAVAEPGSFFDPSAPLRVQFTDLARQNLLGSVLPAAVAPLTAAADWLDRCLQALEQARSGAAALQGGWLTLGADLATLVQPTAWPAQHLALRAALEQAGNVRLAIADATLSGTLEQALAAGEAIELQLGERLFSSALGEIVLDGSGWTLTVPDDASEAWRAATLTRVGADGQREVLQRFELLDRQGAASVAVRLQALGAWYDLGGRALGQGVAELLGALAAPSAGDSGRDPVPVEALQPLLGSGALRRVLASRGLVLPDAPPQQVARETLQAWAALAQAGSAYAVPTAVEGPLVPLVPPLRALDDAARGVLGAHATQAQQLAALLATLGEAAPGPRNLTLALNLPEGTVYTLQYSRDGGQHWLDAPAGWQPELGDADDNSRLLLRVRDIVLPAGSTADFALTLQVHPNVPGPGASAQVLLQDPTRAHLQLHAADEAASAWAQATLTLSQPLSDALTLQLALSERGLDGSTSPVGADAYEVSRDGGQTWQALAGSELTLAAGEQRVLLRHAVTGEGTQLRSFEWQLQASGAGASALGSTTVSAQQRLVPRAPTLTLLARDSGEGEGQVVVALLLGGVSASESHTLQLQQQADAALQLGGSELSVDGGRTWQALAFDAQGSATLVLPAGRDTALVRTALQGLQGTAPALALTLGASAPGLDLAAPPAPTSVRVWRHDAAQPQAWVSDLRIDGSGNSGAGEAVFTVRLSGPASVPVGLDYATAQPATGAADPLTDFIASSGHLRFGAGETAIEVRVPLRQGWSAREAERAFELVLSNPVNALLGDASATATLAGTRPHLVASGAQAAPGGDSFAYLQAGLSHASAQAIALQLQLLGDDADGQTDVGALQVFDEASAAWLDYVAASGVSLAPGQTTLRLRVPVNPRAEGEIEADEALTLIVSAAPGSAPGLTGALQVAAPLALLGNAEAPGLQAQAGRSSFNEGAVFELRGGSDTWVKLSSAQRDSLRAALLASGLDGLAGALQDHTRERLDELGHPQTVLDQAWLDGLRQALQQQAAADAHRLLLDDLVALGASAQPDASQAGVLLLDTATLPALLDRLDAAGLTVHRGASLEDLDQPGALRWDGTSATAQVGAQTLAAWSEQLQRQQAREAALALRLQLALLVPPGHGTSPDDALPIALGPQWLAALADAGVLLLEPSDAAYDPQAIGAVFRRTDADGVQRLYVSPDTLTAWSAQLGVRAALLTSTHSGGSESFTNSYFNDQDPLALDHFDPGAGLDRLLLIYAVTELSRSAFLIEQAGERERVRLLANRFYAEVNLVKDYVADSADVVIQMPASPAAGDGDNADSDSSSSAAMHADDNESGSVPDLLGPGAADDAIPMRELHQARAVLRQVRFGTRTLTEPQLAQLIDDASYRSYLREGELFSSALGSVVMLAAVAAAAQAARDDSVHGPSWAGAHDALLATQFLFQGLQQSLWLAGQLTLRAPGQPPAVLSEDAGALLALPGNAMMKAVLDRYAPGHALWEAVRVLAHANSESEAADQPGGALIPVQRNIDTHGEVPTWVDVNLPREFGGQAEPVRLKIEHEYDEALGVHGYFAVYTPAEGAKQRFEYYLHAGPGGTPVLRTVHNEDIPYTPYWEKGGVLVDAHHRVVEVVGQGVALSKWTSDLWLSLGAQATEEVTPEALEIARQLFMQDAQGQPLDAAQQADIDLMLEVFVKGRHFTVQEAARLDQIFTNWLDGMRARAAIAHGVPGAQPGVSGELAVRQAMLSLAIAPDGPPGFLQRLRRSLGLPAGGAKGPRWFVQEFAALSRAELYQIASGMHIDLGLRRVSVGPLGQHTGTLPARIPHSLSARFKLTAAVLGAVGDVIGVAAAVAGMVAAAEALKAMDEQGGPDTPERRRARGQLIQELAVQTGFALSFTLMGSGSAVRLLQGVTDIPVAADATLSQLMGASEFIGSRIVVAGLALGFATELIRGLQHAARWGADPSHASDEDIYGTVGGLGNATAYGLTLAISVFAAMPELLVVAAPALMLLPDLSAVGRGHDTEARVADLRAAGRDAEADLMQTLAALAYREAAPVFGAFSSLYAKEIVRYQLGSASEQQQLLDAGARTALQNTAEDKLGQGTANFEANWTHGFLNFGVPVNLVVPLNAYLSGDGSQIHWSDGLAHTTEAFEAMAQASATHMQRLMGLGNWFERAFTERLQAQLLRWQSPQAWAGERERELGDMSAVLSARAKQAYTNQMAVDDGSQVTEDFYAIYNQQAARLKQYFDAGQLRLVGDALYGSGNVYVGNIAQWREQAAQAIADDGKELPVEGEDARQARAKRYEASVMLAAYYDTLALAQVHAQRDAYIAEQGTSLSMVDQWAQRLRGSASASDLFVIGSRAEAFGLDPSVYARTRAHSNYGAHADDAGEGNTEWVDGSYKLHLGQYQGAENGTEGGTEGSTKGYWGGWQDIELPEPPALPAEGASDAEVLAYNEGVAAYNERVLTRNAHLMSYLVGVLAREASERGADPGAPPAVASALAGLDPGGNASAAQRLAFEAAQAAAQRVTDYNLNLVAQRVQVLEARAARLQNGDDGGTRLAVQQGLGSLGYTLDTRFSGNAADSVAERWVITASELTRDAHGEPLGSEVQIQVLDEGGNTARALAIDSSALDDVDQVVSVERINVQLRTGAGDDSFVLSDSEGITIDAGAGDDRVFFTPAGHGLTIDLDRWSGIEQVTGSEHDDVVRGHSDEDLQYTDQIGLGAATGGRLAGQGDRVSLLGNGHHLVQISAGEVLTGGGDDLVLVREHAGGTLDIDLGAGTNAVSFALLPGVRLQRDFASGDYSFNQVTWVLQDGSLGQAPLGWGLNGMLRQVQQLIGSAMGDVFELDGGIQALNAGGGDDRIMLASGDVVVDGGAGSDAISVRGAHNTALRIDDAGDSVSIAARVQDVRIAVGARVLEDASAASGAGVQRGVIDANGSLAALVIDIVDGTVRVKAGSGPLTINLLSASARVVIEDSAERIAAGGTITLNLMPGAPLDALGLRAQLTQDHEQVQQGSTGALSLLGGQVLVEPAVAPASPAANAGGQHRALQGIALNASDLQGQPVQIPLDQAVPVAAPTQAPARSVQARSTDAPAPTLHAWAGVRTALDLQSDQRFDGAYSAADAQARAETLETERAGAEQRRQGAQAMLEDLAARPALDKIGVALADLQRWIATGGAQVDRWVFNAADLLHSAGTLGQADVALALQTLGWSAEHASSVKAALQGHAVYSARQGTYLVSEDTRNTWRAQLQTVRAQTSGASALAWLDGLDAQLAAVAMSGPLAGALGADIGQADALLKSLHQWGVISAEQARVFSGVDLDTQAWGRPALQLVFTAPGQALPQGLGVDAGSPVAGEALVVFDPHGGGFTAARETVLRWITDGHDQLYLAGLDLQRLDAQLASVAPYLLRLASGAALYTGLANDTTHDTLEVNSATPLRQALSLQARHGEDTASTPLWLQVERFEGLTRVGSDASDVMVASGAYANLLAGGRGNDFYTLRDAHDIVFENAGEGDDLVYGQGLSHTLAEHVERLVLDHQGAPDAAITLHGTGNGADNHLIGDLDFANVLDGREGGDFMQGGHLGDVYQVDDVRDVVAERIGLDTPDLGGNDWVHSSLSYSLVEGSHLQGQLENLRLLGSADLSATGNALDNRLVGNAGRNRIDGGAGADTVVLSGRLQDYTFLYTSSGEWVVGDQVAGRDNVDRFSRVEAVFFEGSGQTLTLEQLIALGQAGSADVHNVLAYTASYPDLARAFGANELAGLEHYFHYGHAEGRRVGFDALRYQASNIDVPAVLGVGELQAARHYLQYGRFEGRSTDSSLQIQVGASTGANLSGLSGASNGLFGSEHNDILRGSDGSDGLIGGGGNDWLDGDAGDDRIAAGAGHDELIGGRGNELLLGGSGSDTYRFARGDGQDRIVEAGNDGAAIDRLIFEITGAGAIGFDQLWFASSNGGRDLSVSVMGTQDSVTIQNGLQGNGAGVERFSAADRTTADPGDLKTLSAAGLERLVSVMATLAPPTGATSWSDLSRAQRLQLQGLGVWQ